MMTLFSEKVLISNRCISGLMSNLIKKSWMDSMVECAILIESGVIQTLSLPAYTVADFWRALNFHNGYLSPLKRSGFT